MSDDLLVSIRLEASRIEEDAIFSARGHFEAARVWSAAHLGIGGPAAIFAALAGVSALADNLPIAAALAILVTVLTALVTFLNPSQRANRHHVAGTYFNALRNQARILREIDSVCDGPLEDLRKRLSRYRLRANVSLTILTEDWKVAAVWGADWGGHLGLSARPGATVEWCGGLAFTDPRDPEVGARLLLPAESAEATLADNFQPAEPADYDLERISRGLPDGSRDMEVEKSMLLENGFDELGGTDWQKGCYIGQELTARTKYRALIKKRLLPVVFKDGQDAPPEEVAIVQGSREVGQLRSRSGSRALALLRLEALERPEPLLSAGREITVLPPAWLSLASAKKLG